METRELESHNKTVLIINSPFAMLNVQKSKNTVLTSNISIITFLKFRFYTQAAGLLASRSSRLETVLQEAKAKTHEAKAMTHEAKTGVFGLEAEARP